MQQFDNAVWTVIKTISIVMNDVAIDITMNQSIRYDKRTQPACCPDAIRSFVIQIAGNRTGLLIVL